MHSSEIHPEPKRTAVREKTAGGIHMASHAGAGADMSVKKEKPGRRAARRIAVIAAAAAVLVFMEIVAQKSFDTAHYADYYNYDLKVLEKSGAGVGMVIGGASQVYHGCDTELLAQELGYENVIDASSASQVADGTYYMVRDVLDRFDPEYVVVAVTWDRFLPKRSIALHEGRLLVADHLSFAEKAEYFLNCAPVGQWFNLSYLYRFGGTVESLSQLEENYRSKRKIATGDFTINTDASSYYGKNGYVIFAEGSQQGGLNAEDLTFDTDRISGEELKYLNKIADMCRERGKKLIWITIPTSLAETYSIDNYQTAVDYAESFFAATGYPYLNFNMLKNREELFPDTVFSDHMHLAEEGAHIFSQLFADTVKRMEAGEDVSDLFYGSVDEMKKDVHRIVGSYVKVTYNEKSGACTADILSCQNDDITAQYRLSKVLKDGQTEIISDWQEEARVKIPAGVLSLGDSVRLEVRRKGNEEPEASWTAEVKTRGQAEDDEETLDGS